MATLKNLVNEITNIKNELVTCYANLKNNLTEKGVDCNSSDKLLSLANKVGEIELGKKWASGSFTFDYNNRITNTKSFSINCDFVPTIFFVKLDNVHCAREVTRNILISNLFSTTVNEDETYFIKLRVTDLSETNFTIKFERNYADATDIREGITWYAFE